MKLKNIFKFKYRGKKYIISNTDISIKNLKCYCINNYGVVLGFINSNLNQYDKQKMLHKIVNQKNLRKCL